ncbi:MAG: ComEC/Rec2 family competence protein [Phycisphaerales bacterium]|nr:ComEC/Rec2 family competence protein [Phycisphaerales bacterium]
MDAHRETAGDRWPAGVQQGAGGELSCAPEAAAEERLLIDERRPTQEKASRAPLLFPALAFLCGMVISERLIGVVSQAGWLIALLVSVIVVGVMLARSSPAGGAALLLCCALAGAARHAASVNYPANHVARLASAESTLTRVTAEVITAPSHYSQEIHNPFTFFSVEPRTRFLAEVRTFDADEPFAAKGVIRVTVLGEPMAEFRPGQRLRLTGWLTKPKAARNPGEVDWAQWNRLQGVSATLLVPAPAHVEVIDSTNGWRGRLDAARATARGLLFEPGAMAEPTPETQALEAMVLGQRSSVPRAVNEAFLRTGSIHYLTVSGFHVGILAAAMWFVVRRLLRRGVTAAGAVTLIVLIAYAALAEATAPVMRATIVGSLVCVAAMTRRPHAILNWLALAAGVICAISPLELFRPGFQLSFVLTAALVVFVPVLWRRLTAREDTPPSDAASWPALFGRWAARFVGGLALVNVVAWLMAIPLTLLHFGQFAPLAPMQSMVVTPLALVNVLLGFAALAFGAVPWVGAALRAAVDGASYVLLAAVGWLGAPDFALVEASLPAAWLVYGTYVVVFAVVGRWAALRARRDDSSSAPPARQRQVALVAPLLAVLVAWGGWVFWPRFGATPELVVLDVGHGSAAMIRDSRGVAWLFDAGSLANRDAGEIVNDASRALGVRRIGALTVSHANFDHFSGAPTILRQANAPLLVSPYFERLTKTDPIMRRLVDLLPADRRIETVAAGARFELADVEIETLWPPPDLDAAWETNDRSLVFRVRSGPTRVLITGDIEEAAMRGLLARAAAGEIDLESDILVAPHHGAWIDGASDDFYRSVNPALVIASAGKETPRLTAGLGFLFGECPAMSTRDCGAIRVRLGRAGWSVTPTIPAGEVTSDDR